MSNGSDFNYAEKIMETAQRLSALETAHNSLKEEVSHLRGQNDDINDKLDQLLTEVAGWKGKFGGFILALSCVWAFLASMWTEIVKFIKGH